MTKKERVLHSVLFEVFALLLVVPLGQLVGGIDTHTMTGVAILMSLLAMAWNYVYNLGFDKVFGANRMERKLGLRVLHGILFEFGLMLVTLPILMLILQRGFWDVLALEITMIVFFLVYAVVYNWLYDVVRARFVSPALTQSLSEMPK